MGFRISLLFLKLDETRKDFRVWKIESRLRIGRITAPSKIRSAKARAAFHFASYLVEGKLCGGVWDTGKRFFAPPFASVEGEGLVSGTEFVEVDDSDSAPTWGVIEDHNTARTTCEDYPPKCDIVFTYPLAWITCEMLLEWLEEGEVLGAYGFPKFRAEDPEAYLLYTQWKEQVAVMLGQNCKVLFLFNDERVFEDD